MEGDWLVLAIVPLLKESKKWVHNPKILAQRVEREIWELGEGKPGILPCKKHPVIQLGGRAEERYQIGLSGRQLVYFLKLAGARFGEFRPVPASTYHLLSRCRARGGGFLCS